MERFFVEDIFIHLTSVATCSSSKCLTFQTIKHIHSSYVCIVNRQWSHSSKCYKKNFLTTGWRTPESQTTIYFHSDKASQFPISSAWCKHHLIFSPRQWYHKTLPLCLFALQSCQLTIVAPLCQAQPHAIYRSSVDKESMFGVGYSFSLQRASGGWWKMMHQAVDPRLRAWLWYIGYIQACSLFSVTTSLKVGCMLIYR